MNSPVYIRAILLLVAFLLIPVLSQAAQPEFRVAYVDLEKALRQTKAGSEAQEDYEKELKVAQEELDDKKSEFERKKERFVKQADSLSESAKLERQEELRELERDLKRTFTDSQEKLRRTNLKLVGGLMKTMREVVKEVGEREGFTLVLEKGSQTVLYADSSIDITPKVVAAFDARTD